MKKGIISAASAFAGAVAGAVTVSKVTGKTLINTQNTSNKYHTLFEMMGEWLKLKQEGINLSSYFEKNGYKNIAIYGMGLVGETLIRELKNSNINIEYGIDRRAGAVCADIEAVSIDDELKEVDVIVVTAVTYFDEIAELLSSKVDCPIISMEDVLYEL